VEWGFDLKGKNKWANKTAAARAVNKDNPDSRAVSKANSRDKNPASRAKAAANSRARPVSRAAVSQAGKAGNPAKVAKVAKNRASDRFH
jgi:hypothetical protein